MYPTRFRFFLLAVLSLWALSHADVGQAQQFEIKATEFPAEKCRRILGEVTTLDWRGGSVLEALNHLEKKTGILFRLDGAVGGNMGIMLGNVMPDGVAGAPGLLELKGRKEKLRTILGRFLRDHGMAYAIMKDHVLVTSESLAFARQLQQRVDVDAKKRPARSVLSELSRSTGVAVVIDPAVAKAIAGDVDLQVDDVSAETALRLLAELVGTRAERLGDVLFVTSPERADGIRRAETARRDDVRNLPMRFVPPGMGGGFGGFQGGGGPPMGVPPIPPPDMDVAPGFPPPPMAQPPNPPMPSPPPPPMDLPFRPGNGNAGFPGGSPN